LRRRAGQFRTVQWAGAAFANVQNQVAKAVLTQTGFALQKIDNQDFIIKTNTSC
jgi:hypothetical protein